MRVDPDSTYLEPTGLWLFDRASGTMAALEGIRIHWKDGNRWRHVTLVPNDDETLPELYRRLGAMIAEGGAEWTQQLAEKV